MLTMLVVDGTLTYLPYVPFVDEWSFRTVPLSVHDLVNGLITAIW